MEERERWETPVDLPTEVMMHIFSFTSFRQCISQMARLSPTFVGRFSSSPFLWCANKSQAACNSWVGEKGRNKGRNPPVGRVVPIELIASWSWRKLPPLKSFVGRACGHHVSKVLQYGSPYVLLSHAKRCC